MVDLWTDLLGCLDLRPAEGEDDGQPKPGTNGDPEPATVLTGANQQLTYRRLFGGQMLAQFIRAACLVCPDKAVKSLHTLFPKEGRAEEPVRYEVRKHHEGRSFATLGIVARQPRGVIATASVSMHAAEDGRERQTVPLLPSVPKPEHTVKLGVIPWETRATMDLDTKSSAWPEYELWMRTPETDPALAPALTAYATDLTLIGTALRPIDGTTQQDSGTAFTSAVTSHTVWFHRPFRTDSWLLLRQHSPLVAHGRCFGRGDVLTEDASLVASFAQEALLRFTN